MALAIDRRHLRFTQHRLPAPARGELGKPGGQCSGAARRPPVGMIRRIFIGAGEAPLIDGHALDRQPMRTHAGIGIFDRADQLVAKQVDHLHVERRDVVGIDLVAAENELVRALQGVFEQVPVEDDVVDPCHRIRMLVRRAAARTVDEAQVLERIGRQRETRQEIFDVAEREMWPRELGGAAVAGRDALQQPER